MLPGGHGAGGTGRAGPAVNRDMGAVDRGVVEGLPCGRARGVRGPLRQSLTGGLIKGISPAATAASADLTALIFN